MSPGIIFMTLAKPVIKKYPREGEIAIRQGLRAFGKFRGERLRKWHEKLGLPINMYSLITWWDIPSIRESGGLGEESKKFFDPIFTPYRVVQAGIQCILYDVHREHDFEHYGYIYCDEIHQEIAKAYHPEAIVEIHENLMKNDPYCHFTWMMPPDAPEIEIDNSGYEKMEKWEEEKPEELSLLYAKRDSIISGILYYFLAKAIIDRFGDEGKSMVESSLIEMGKMRGTYLKRRLDESNDIPTVRKIFENMDLQYTKAWDLSFEELGDIVKIECTYCPLAEVWHELGDKLIGPMYCRSQYQAIFNEVDSDSRVEISEMKAEGAGLCNIVIKL
jgi:hypothetical protein